MKKYFSGSKEVFHPIPVSPSNVSVMKRVGCIKLPKEAKPLAGVPIKGGEGYMLTHDVRNWLPVTRVIAYKDKPSLHVCDARCENANGDTCECACGGTNHGINRAVIGVANIVLHMSTV